VDSAHSGITSLASSPGLIFNNLDSSNLNTTTQDLSKTALPFTSEALKKSSSSCSPRSPSYTPSGTPPYPSTPTGTPPGTPPSHSTVTHTPLGTEACPAGESDHQELPLSYNCKLCSEKFESLELISEHKTSESHHMLSEIVDEQFKLLIGNICGECYILESEETYNVCENVAHFEIFQKHMV
jgi:hypothetical protein